MQKCLAHLHRDKRSPSQAPSLAPTDPGSSSPTGEYKQSAPPRSCSPWNSEHPHFKGKPASYLHVSVKMRV